MLIHNKLFKGESYFCIECQKEILETEVNKVTWSCEVCQKKIMIDVQDEKDVKLVRLYPKEMNENDEVYDARKRELHKLKGIKLGENECKIGIKDYRTCTFKYTDLINCEWNEQ
ncbi:hypothetical protein [Exiguobacterium sp. s123]|uniref:hypothetical protein n=1 Tax=Exiguobacterium sp. s123 TaxID=2751289 RepID=UPI001BE8CAEC|nr:hypothetical protein [Exiguobacterium sp. s123]